MMSKKYLSLIIAVFGSSFILLYGEVSTSSAAPGDKFSANMDGLQEVPLVETTGSGVASFLVKDNAITYNISVRDTDRITGIHIHEGTSGENGEVLVSLYASNKGEQGATSLADRIAEKIDISSVIQRSSQFSKSGFFHASDLDGSLQGKTLDDLVSVMKGGQTYVNVHTQSHPDGEIRGQISIG